MIGLRTPATHPFAVEIHERQRDNRGGNMIGLQLFETREDAERYAEDQENDRDWDGWCSVRRAKSGDREFA